MSKTIPTTCPDHAWCWGACDFPENGRTEHRTYYRILDPTEQFGETRRDYHRHVATGVAQVGDAAPLVRLSIQTARRSIEVGLTFQELLQLQCDLAHAGADLAAAMDRGVKLVTCSRCSHTFHPDALGGRGRPCRDCGGSVQEVGGAPWTVPKVECRDCDQAFDPDSSPHTDRCGECAERVDGLVTQ